MTTRIYANSSCVLARISGGGAYMRCGANELKKPIADSAAAAVDTQDKTSALCANGGANTSHRLLPRSSLKV